MPPNATLIKVTYNSRQRNQVELEWQVESETNGGWTGFSLEHRLVSERPGKGRNSNGSLKQAKEKAAATDWYQNIIQDPDVRSHTVQGLTPTFTYQFRIMSINYRTVGYPSSAKTPGTGYNMGRMSTIYHFKQNFKNTKNEVVQTVL